jgi:hypothetical protein
MSTKAFAMLSSISWRCRDAVVNGRFARADERFLITRHPARTPRFYDVLLDWTQSRLPRVRSRFELRMLPLRARNPSRYVLHAPWLQDPVQQWSAAVYEQAKRLSAELDGQGIPTINPVDRLTNAAKSTGARLIGGAGIRTPRAVPIDDAERFRSTFLGLTLPLLVREDWGHSDERAIETGQVVLCDTPDAVRKLELERFTRPVAMEFIETRDPGDGLYRKYRYVAAGDTGVALHLHVKDHWFVKGANQLYSEEIREEDVAYLSGPDPNHEALQRARRALKLDFVAFDYSYDRGGRLVVWEANPYPYFHFIGGRRVYRTPAIERAFAAILQLYHTRAGLPVPEEVERLLALRPSVSRAVPAEAAR